MAQASNVIPLPVPKFTFAANDFQGKELLTRYDENRELVAICQRFLECSPDQMKKRVVSIEATDAVGDDTVQRIISEFEKLAADYVALGSMFDSAAARLTAVHRRLI